MSLKICFERENIFLLVIRPLLFQPRAILYTVFITPVRLTMIVCGELGPYLNDYFLIYLLICCILAIICYAIFQHIMYQDQKAFFVKML